MAAIKWVRKASDMEVQMDRLAKAEMLLVCYRLSLSTALPLQPAQVRQALGHLYRKAPNLRVCLGERDGETYFREMPSETIDFEVMSGSTVDEVSQLIHTHKYESTTGPLWCARLVPQLDPAYHPARYSSFREDLQATFPHCYHLLFGFNHTMGDGQSYRDICGAFIAILDDVISGKAVDDDEQIGIFDLNEELFKDFEEIRAKINTDEAYREKCMQVFNEGKPEISALAHVLPPPLEGPDKRTVLYNQNLDEETTTRLIKHCKEAGISVSSCFSAVCNVALVDLMLEKGVSQETYSISNAHLINLRRYWEPEKAAKTLGCYIATSSRLFMETPAMLSKSHFWDYAKKVHQKFYALINGKDFPEKAAFIGWCYENSRMDLIMVDMTFNTRGDLTKLFGGRKNVQVTHFIPTTSIHNSPIPWDHVFSTLRGQFTYTLKYNSGMVTEDLVAHFSDLIYKRLQEIVA